MASANRFSCIAQADFFEPQVSGQGVPTGRGVDLGERGRRGAAEERDRLHQYLGVL
jgi:hypothetical protein